MWYWLLIGIGALGWTLIPHLLLLNKRSTATIAWLLALLLLPVIGPLLYLMIGSERVKRRRMRRRNAFRDKKEWPSADLAKLGRWLSSSAHQSLDESTVALLEGLSSITRLPVATASPLKVLRKAPAFYAALQDDIRNAQTSILIETYIWRDDEVGRQFLNLLIEACQRGVIVQLLIDELGSFWLKESYFRPLRDAGGQFSWDHTLSPLKNRYSFNLRNHRKLQIIDGEIAYVGGMNFGNEYLGRNPAYGDWADVQVRLEGKAIDVFRQIFAEDWFFATGKDDTPEPPASRKAPKETSVVQVLRGGPDEEDHPMLRVNVALAAAATKHLWIATGYFVPGEIIQTTLQVAAARGVDVRILVSRKNQHPYLVKAGRSYYDALLRQGVRIFEYSKGIEHSKYIIIDDDWASIGSCNYDERSMRLNFELGILVLCRKTNHELATIFKKTLSESREIDRTSFSKRPYWEKLLESALRPLSPVL